MVHLNWWNKNKPKKPTTRNTLPEKKWYSDFKDRRKILKTKKKKKLKIISTTKLDLQEMLERNFKQKRKDHR